MKTKFIFILSSILFALAACDESKDNDILDATDKQYVDYELSIVTPIQEIEKKMSESDTCQVMMFAKRLSGTLPQTRGEIIPYQGKITNMGNKKTLWKYGVGENLVPQVFCGTNIMTDLTISELWKISVTVDLTNENYAVRGFIGEKSGWSDKNINNPQTRAQLPGGTVDNPEFHTYVWKIISDINGKNYGYTNCYKPLASPNDARIYIRIYE